MSISLLPPEILHLISNYSTHYEYLLVCHSWSDSFRPALYEQINFRSRRQFRNLIRTILKNKFLGLYVKHISFEDGVGLSRQEFEDILPICFPMLQTLDFNPKLWKYQRQHKQIPWNERILQLPTLDRVHVALPLIESYGNYLQHLSLSGNMVHELQATDQLLNVFKHTPQLTSLKLCGRDTINDPPRNYQSAEFTLLDIQNIHKLLSKLESLELIHVALSIWSPLPPTTFVQPQTFMQRFLLTQSEIDHHQWIILIANLYPNLKELVLEHVGWKEAYKNNGFDAEAVKSCYAYLAKRCSRLKKVHLDSLARCATQVFYENLKSGQGLVSMRNGVIPATTTASELKQLAYSTLQCTDARKTSCLDIRLWRDLQSIQNIMQPISNACHYLQELDLSGGNFAYSWSYGCDLDVITRFCPRLVTLKLSKTRLTTTSSAVEDEVFPSKIKSMHLDRVHFDTKSFSIIPLMCPQLNKLEMLNCVKDKDIFDQRIDLNLSTLALDVLRIEQMYIRPSSYMERTNIDAAIIAVEQKERQSNTSKRVGGRWYHLYNKKAPNKTNIRQMKRLDDTQSRQIEKYQMKEEDWDKLEETSFRGTYRDKKYWKADIPYGYIYVSCHSINILIFNKVKI